MVEARQAYFAYVDFQVDPLQDKELQDGCGVDVPLGLRVLASFLKCSMDDILRYGPSRPFLALIVLQGCIIFQADQLLSVMMPHAESSMFKSWR